MVWYTLKYKKTLAEVSITNMPHRLCILKPPPRSQLNKMGVCRESGGDIQMEEYINENKGINLQNESNLHMAIKKWYMTEGDRLEVKVGKSIVDILRGDLVIEIQLRNFYAIKNKIVKLTAEHKVRLVYPIPFIKWIVYIDDKGVILSKRKSPKKGDLFVLFDELMRMPDLVNNENFEIEVLFIEEEEIRSDDGMGSWRRKGVSILNRNFICVHKTALLKNRKDFLMFIPNDIKVPFTTKTYSEKMNITIRKSRKVIYCLKKMGLIKQVGKSRNLILYALD